VGQLISILYAAILGQPGLGSKAGASTTNNGESPMKKRTIDRTPTAVPGIALSAALCLGMSAPAAATNDAWEFEVVPYLWAAGLSGTVKAGPTPALNVNADFGTILDHLDMGAMGTLEGRKDRWGFLVDAIYVDLGGGKSTVFPVVVSAEGKVTEQIYSVAGTYRALEGPTNVDVVGGARYVNIAADLSLFPAVPFTLSTGAVWWDPYIGVIARHKLDEHWSLAGYADIGGFGVGSKFAYQLLVGTSYQFTPDISGKFGFRYLHMDYNKDQFEYNAGMGGLYLGVGFRF
jgi:opacity protein-like surface antigen